MEMRKNVVRISSLDFGKIVELLKDTGNGSSGLFDKLNSLADDVKLEQLNDDIIQIGYYLNITDKSYGYGCSPDFTIDVDNPFIKDNDTCIKELANWLPVDDLKELAKQLEIVKSKEKDEFDDYYNAIAKIEDDLKELCNKNLKYDFTYDDLTQLLLDYSEDFDNYYYDKDKNEIVTYDDDTDDSDIPSERLNRIIDSALEWASMVSDQEFKDLVNAMHLTDKEKEYFNIED